MSANLRFIAMKALTPALVVWLVMSATVRVAGYSLGDESETVSAAADVIALHKKGTSDEKIIEIIRQSPSAPVLSADAIGNLKAAGISEPVITALKERGAASAEQKQEPSPAVPKNYSGEAVSSFQTFHIKGDRGNFREDATLKKGFGLESFLFDWRGPQFFFSQIRTVNGDHRRHWIHCIPLLADVPVAISSLVP